jgi:hypothetical protein
MSIDSRYIQRGVAVMVQIGEEGLFADGRPSKKGTPRWRCGIIVDWSNSGHAYGSLITADIAPSQEAGITNIKRYSNKDRIRLATIDEAQAFAERRTTASLLAQTRVGDTQSVNDKAPTVRRCRLYNEDMSPVALHDNVVNAILGHPDIAKQVNSLFRDSSNTLVSKHQAVLYKAELLEKANAKLAEDLQLSQTSLKSCDTERRTLLVQQDELQKAYNNVNHDLSVAKGAASRVQPITDHQALDKAGKARGFVLWNPASKIPPREVYPSLDMAETVQKSMCERYPNNLFHIMPIGPGAMMKTVSQLVSA